MKLIIGFYILIFLLWTIGQGGAVIGYGIITEGYHLQVDKEEINPALIAVAKGIGLSDLILMQPLLIIAVLGLAKQRFYGLISSWMVLALLIYWPTIWFCNNYFCKIMSIKYKPICTTTLIFIWIIIGFSIWATIYLYRYAKDRYMLGLKT